MSMEPVLDRRRAGILLHPTSLPGPYANGDLGVDARRFVDFLSEAGFSVWQILPLGPTHEDRSPYHSLSVHAGDPRLISIGLLREWGWLDQEPASAQASPRAAILRQAREGFEHHAKDNDRDGFLAFVTDNSHWLEDYVLFQALREECRHAPWWLWPDMLRDREPGALKDARTRLGAQLDQFRFEQFVFARQWQDLRRYANGRGVQLLGDMPIFVAHDSAEVWMRRALFRLDATGQPTVVAGVPPDYFSATGQRWGNPLYDWARMREEGFAWWVDRVATELRRVDLLRIDHFRGFEACWEIPAAEATAVNGRWVEAPGETLFETLLARFGRLPFVAEDLGYITPQVHALRKRYRLPGMSVLQFAFDGGGDNPYLPHNHERETVAYTGTHDNDTTLSWFQALPPESQLSIMEYLGYPYEPMPQPLVRAAFASVANLAIVPMQDVLGLGRGHRMNVPGTTEGNWRWRFDWGQIGPDTGGWLRRALKAYGRAA